MTAKWRPDTCDGCQIDVFDWDNAIGNSLANCNLHQGLKDNAHFYQVYKKECQPFNLARGYVQQNYPDATFTITFDDKRNIILQTQGLQSSDIQTIQDYCNANLLGTVLVS